jgi:hypothetical protein
MRLKLFYLLSLLVLCGTPGDAHPPKNIELAAEINCYYEIDQKVQNDIVAAYQAGTGKEKMDELFKLQALTFKTHIPILKAMIRKHGFPTFELVGEAASKNFFVMIQHADADPEFQRFCLKKARPFVKLKQISGLNFAYLTDRVSLNSGKPQIYGTQLEYDRAGNASSKSLKDPKNVNRRRTAVGLEPLEEYLKKATELHKKQNTKKAESGL